MDRNVVALLREDAISVDVYFKPAPTLDEFSRKPDSFFYTYVALRSMGLKQGDVVVVPVSSDIEVAKVSSRKFISNADQLTDLKLATVEHVHDRMMIEPGSAVQYKWVAAKVDLAPARELMEHNAKILATITKAYTKNMRHSFAVQVVACLNDDDAANLRALLGVNK